MDTATHAYRFDHVQQVEKAGLTAQNQLVLLVEGRTAEVSRVRPLTMKVTLPVTENEVHVPPRGFAEDWETEVFNRTDTLWVAVAPRVVVPEHASAIANRYLFPDLEADRTLYLIEHPAPDRRSDLFYAAKGDPPRDIEIYLDGRNVKTPSRYPLLLLVPLTVPIDLLTWPIQLFFWPSPGDRGTRPP